MRAIHVAVNRSLYGARAEPLLPGQALDLAEAMAAYTIGSAFVNHLDDVTGSIEPGKLADLVVLDRDPFTLPAGRDRGDLGARDLRRGRCGVPAPRLRLTVATLTSSWLDRPAIRLQDNLGRVWCR